jgi:hypothetical protein
VRADPEPLKTVAAFDRERTVLAANADGPHVCVQPFEMQ